MKQPTGRIVEIDGLRGIAILLVLICHYVSVCFVAQPGTIGGWLLLHSTITWCGVDLFFVLSGFLICGILLDNLNSKNYFRTFYIRRSFRILPVYILYLLPYFYFTFYQDVTNPLGELLVKNNIPWWAPIFFLQNYFIAANGDYAPIYLSITWSLAIEEQFYLIFPAIVKAFSKISLTTLLIMTVLISPGLRLLALYNLPHGHLFASLSTFTRADGLALGALCAIMVRNDTINKFIDDHSSYLKILFLSLLVPMAWVISYAHLSGSYPTLVAGHSILALFFSTTLLLAYYQQSKLLGKILRSKVLLFFGGISYSLYLFHQVVRIALTETVFQSLNQVVANVLVLGIAVSAAYISTRWLEAPFIRRGHESKY